MNLYLQILSETAQIVLPIFLLLSCGFILRQIELIDDTFVDQASRLVFTLTLPILIFLNVSRSDLLEIVNPRQVAYLYGVTIFSAVALYIFAQKYIKEPADQGVFVQASFRGNFAIIGLAIAYNMFGDSGLPSAVLLLALIIPLYNVLSIIALTLPMQGGFKPWRLLKSMISNPLILAVLTALPFSFFDWQLPQVIETSGLYLGNLSLPLALLAIGGSLNIRHIQGGSSLALHGSLLKLVSLPLLLTFGAWLIGIRGDELALLFILFGSPTAATSFVMAKVMGGNGQLAANIIAITTLACTVTLGTGIYLLKLLAV